MTIYDDELDRNHVELYLKKARNQTSRDSIYFYFSRANLIAEKIQYNEGQIGACQGLIDFYKNDKEMYNRLEYALLLVRLREKSGTANEKADAYLHLGKLYFDEKLFKKAIETFQASSELPNTSQNRMYDAHIWLVRSQINKQELSDALITARKLEFTESLTPYQKIELQKEKAEIYHGLGAFEEELGSYQNILKTIDKNPQFAYLKPTVFNNLGYAQKYLKNYPAAKASFLSTIAFSKSNDQELQGAAYFNLGLIYHNNKQIDSALICFENAKKIYLSAKSYKEVASCLNMEAMSYHHENDQFNAQRKLNEAFEIEKSHQLLEEESKSHEIQSFVHADLFEFELALASFKRHLTIENTLKSEKNKEADRLSFVNYQANQLEKGLRLIWSNREKDLINEAKQRAEDDARAKANELKISTLENSELRARNEYNRLVLIQERLNLENKEKELELTQRENRLKELALEKERLVVIAKEKENKLLAQKNELEKQRRLNQEQGYKNKLRLIFGALLFILLILLLILIAYRQLRKRKKQIEAQNVIIEESRTAIELEKEKSEGLLLNILPIPVAEELKQHGSSKPRLYNNVSVGFTDFSGFTMISEKLSAEELVAKLDEIFLEFDKIIEKHGLQRIKTIGDAYMFAAGLPEPVENHSVLIVDAAIDMRDFIEDYNKRLGITDPKWNIRIGVNCGPVVAGVIGIKKFAYDIWGDTVNTAARMESSGEIGKVNISGSTFSKVKHHYVTNHRGKIAAKNKGLVDMYFVERK